MDLISVIVPVYKVELYLDQCVKSLVNQTYKNLEIILVDDGSPDQCPLICDRWALKDNRIKVIHKENGGLSDARNAGLDIAKGDYISFVDSDDWVDPEFISLLLKLLKENNALISECGVNIVSEEGGYLGKRCCNEKTVVLNRVDALKRMIKEDGVYQTVWNKLYKKDLLDNIRFEKGKYHEDEFYAYQVFDQSQKFVVSNELLYNYRRRKASIMGADYSVKRLDGLEARWKRMEYFREDQELSSFTKARIQYDLLFHYQNSLKYLNGEDQKRSLKCISSCLKKLGKIDYTGSDMPVSHRIWFLFFRWFPGVTAGIRNLVGIGL